MSMNDTLANDFLEVIREREINRGGWDRNEVNSYALGYLIGTLSTLIRKYPRVGEDIQSYINHIQNDITGKQNAR
jgi:hypothetical protein